MVATDTDSATNLAAAGSGTKCPKNQTFDVIKMREMRGAVGKKTLKKEMDNPSFV